MSNHNNFQRFRRANRRRQRTNLRHNSNRPMSRIKTCRLTRFAIKGNLLRKFGNQFKNKLQISMILLTGNRQQRGRTNRHRNDRSNGNRTSNNSTPRRQRRYTPGRQHRVNSNNTNRPNRKSNNKSNRLLLKVIARLNSRHIMQHTMRHRNGMMTSGDSRRRYHISPANTISQAPRRRCNSRNRQRNHRFRRKRTTTNFKVTTIKRKNRNQIRRDVGRSNRYNSTSRRNC